MEARGRKRSTAGEKDLRTRRRNTSCEQKLCYEIGFDALRRRGMLGTQK
jgi:hypothetical protein